MNDGLAPRSGEVLFEFIRGTDRFRCELRDHGELGVEAQFYKNDEFFRSRRFNLRDFAVKWAQEQRAALEKGGA